MDYLLDPLADASIPIIGDFYDENRLGILILSGSKGLANHLVSRGIDYSERAGNLRIALHYYNNKQGNWLFCMRNFAIPIKLILR